MAFSQEQIAALHEAGISTEQFEEFQRAHALLKELYTDNDIGTDLKKLVKKKYPKAVLPDLEILEAGDKMQGEFKKMFEELTTGLNKKIDAFAEERQKEKDEARISSFSDTVHRVSKERGYTKEGTDKVLELMKERGIHNFDDAAVIFESNQPKPARSRGYSSRMNFVSPSDKDDDSFKKLMADPEQFMTDELFSALSEKNGE